MNNVVTRRPWVIGCEVEMSRNVFFNLIPSHSQRFIPIPMPDPRFSPVLFPFLSHSHCLFPFPPAPIPIQVDIFCHFIAALLLIVFWVAGILKLKDTALLSWRLWQSSVSLYAEVPGEADVAPLTGCFSFSDWKWKNVEFLFTPIPIKPFPCPFQFPWNWLSDSHSHRIPWDPWEFPIDSSLLCTGV